MSATAPLAFGILSSREDPRAVTQLIAALGPTARVFVHHDLTQRPAPALSASGARLVPDPVATRWGAWSLCAAVLKLVRAACEDPDWHYFQLLSATCLPIRPLAEFEHHVSHSPAQVHLDQVALADDPVALMSHGFRAYAPMDTLAHRALRRLRRWYLGPGPGRVDRQGLSFSLPPPDRAARVPARLAAAAMRRIAQGSVPGFPHPFGDSLRCHAGSTWWGACRAACESIAQQPDDGELLRYCRRMLVPDEFFFQTLLANGGWRIGESNHLVSRFEDAHPVPIGLADLPVLRASPRFFARKFPDDPGAPVRRAVLAGLAGGDAGTRGEHATLVGQEADRNASTG